MEEKKLKGTSLITYYLSIFLILFGLIILFPLVMLIFYPNESNYAGCFLLPGTLAILIGYLIHFLLRGNSLAHLENHQDAFLVVSIWVLAILISSIPFLLTGKFNFTQSVFEVTSGYTTTGLSVVDVSTCPHIFLFYRSLTLFVGGVGFVLIMTSAVSDKLSLNIYEAEGHNDKLLPNLAKSSRLIFSLYFGYIVLGTILYLICGMNLFDAMNHSIAAISTGGFSTRPGSIYDFHSTPIEIVTIILMLLGSTNFIIHIFLLKGKFKTFFLHSEILFSMFIIIFLSAISITLLSFSSFQTDHNIFMVVIFQIVSALTTTGFQNISSMNILPHFLIGIMIILMLIGGELGSTAGGMKQYRVIVCLKGFVSYVKRSINNRKIIQPSYIRKADQKIFLEDKIFLENFAFVFTYLLIFLIGSIIFSSFGYSLEDSMFEFASCLSTVGLSMGITSYMAHPIILWTAIIGMLLGRLEIFVIIYSIIRMFRNMKGGIQNAKN